MNEHVKAPEAARDAHEAADPAERPGSAARSIDEPAPGTIARWRSLLSRPATLSGLYPWYITIAAMDVMLTWIILLLGGKELNALAVLALDRAGVHGLILLKFATVVTVIAICEYIAWKQPAAARRLALAAVAISAVPVVVGILEIARTPPVLLAQ